MSIWRVALQTKSISEILSDLSTRDSALAKVIDVSEICPFGQANSKVTNFASLVESVVSQQLSVKAADNIHSRLRTTAKGLVSQKVWSDFQKATYVNVGSLQQKLKPSRDWQTPLSLDSSILTQFKT